MACKGMVIRACAPFRQTPPSSSYVRTGKVSMGGSPEHLGGLRVKGASGVGAEELSTGLTSSSAMEGCDHTPLPRWL